MKKLEIRENDHIIFSGVCSSLSNFLSIDTSLLRLVFIISGFLSYYTFFFYIVASIVIPSPKFERNETLRRSQNNSFYISVAITVSLFIFMFHYFGIPLFTFSIKMPFILSLILQLFVVFGLSIFYYSKTDILLKKDRDNKIISGVFSGLAEQLQIDVSILRLMYTLLLTFFNTYSVILIGAYLFLSIILPYNVEENTSDM